MIITGRAPILSSSDPSSGLLSPAASGAAALNAENHARLHPKWFTTGRKNTPPAFTGPQIRNSVANRVPTTSQRPLLSSAIVHLAARDLDHRSRGTRPNHLSHAAPLVELYKRAQRLFIFSQDGRSAIGSGHTRDGVRRCARGRP